MSSLQNIFKRRVAVAIAAAASYVIAPDEPSVFRLTGSTSTSGSVSVSVSSSSVSGSDSSSSSGSYGFGWALTRGGSAKSKSVYKNEPPSAAYIVVV